MVAPILLRRADAAKALGMSVDHFERHVQPFIRTVIVGRLVLSPVSELERWVSEQARAVRP